MRLIDADEIESALRYAEFDRNEKVNWIEAYRRFMEMIENAPTAYDVDKVVEQLQTEADRWKESGMEYEDEKELGIAEGHERAIEIVKVGGRCLN